MELIGLPGSELIGRGLADLAAGIETVESLLVRIGGPRLRTLGFEVPVEAPGLAETPEHRLYELLAGQDPRRAHSRYNALLRRLASFERTARCAR